MHDPALTGLLNMDAEPVREFFREAPVMMHSIDGEGRLVELTSYWATRLGYLPEEMIGRRSVDFLTPESRRLAETTILPRFFRDGEIRKQPYDFLRKDGTILSVLLSAVTLRNADGQINRSLALIVEDDGRDMLHRDLQSALLQAGRATRSKSQFLTAMSHEIRTPMNAITGFAQLLKLTSLSTKQSNYVEAILSSARQLMGRLSELTELAQLEFSDAKLVMRKTRVRDLFDPLASVWSASAQEKNLEFEYRLDPGLPDYIVTDRNRVQQVVTSYLSNALKHTETGKISLVVSEVHRRNDRVCIAVQVQDTGPGISDDRKKALFQPFADADIDATKAGGGWGLGLSICRSIAVLMGAKVDVDSAPGEGARFLFTFDAPMGESDG